MMDGRVKTLHPKVHAGILARRHRPDDRSALAAHGDHPDRSRGGQSLPVREGGGAAGHRVRRSDRGNRYRRPQPGARGGQELQGRPGGGRSGGLRQACWRRSRRLAGRRLSFRFDLARKAIAHTADYDHMIAATLDAVQLDDASARHSCREAVTGAAARHMAPTARQSA